MPLELKNVSYIYQPNTPNESTALNNVSLTINDGEFIGIIRQRQVNLGSAFMRTFSADKRTSFY